MTSSSYGWRPLARHRFAVLVTSCILSLLSLICFVVGAAGASDSRHTIEKVPWATATQSFLGEEYELYFGLTIFVINGEAIGYDDKICTQDLCEDGEEKGEAIMALMYICVLFTFPVAVLTYIRMESDNNVVKGIGIALSLVSFTFSLASVILWGSVYSELEDELEDDVENSIGYILTLVGCISIALVVPTLILLPSSATIFP